MVTLRCSKCGTKLGVVTDVRFGLPPTGSLCVACTTPAFYRVPGARPVRAQPLVSLVLRARRA